MIYNEMNIKDNGNDIHIVVANAVSGFRPSNNMMMTVEQFKKFYDASEKVFDRNGFIGLKIKDSTLYIPTVGKISGLDRSSIDFAGWCCLWLKSDVKNDVSSECSIPEAKMAIFAEDRELIIYSTCVEDLALTIEIY